MPLSNLLDQLYAVNVLKDLIVPAAAALGALALATRKFRQERLWQEKYAAYQRVIGSIEVIRYWGEEVSSEVHMLPTIGWWDGKERAQFYAEAKREVVKQISIGAILLSDDFVNELTEFQAALFERLHSDSEEFYDDRREEHYAFGKHAEKVRDIADAHLPKLIELARKDLGAERSWLSVRRAALVRFVTAPPD